MIPVIEPGALTDTIAVIILVLFAGGVLGSRRKTEWRDLFLVAGWILFAIYWGLLAPYYAFELMSLIEGLLAALAVPASLYTAYLLWNGRESIVRLSTAVFVAGVMILGIEIFPGAHTLLVETVTRQIEFGVSLLGYEPTVVRLAEYDNTRTTFQFITPENHELTFTIITACTGLGSIAIVSGLISAAPAPVLKKVRALAVVIPIIYGLNLLRTVFIAITFGYQKLDFAPSVIMPLFGTSDPYLVSYLWADRIIGQGLSVIALILIVLWLLRVLPELVVVVEDILYVITRDEYDLSTFTKEEKLEKL